MAAAFSHLVAAALLGLVGSLSIPDTARTLSRAALPQLRARNTRACTYESIRRSLEDDARYQQSLGTANPGPEELQVIVAPAEGKGMGAFAAEPAEKGRWICTYEGELLTLIETEQRYAYEEPAYLFTITPDLYRDANFSTHFSRYFNHDEHGNLDHTVDVAQQRIDFYALRDIAVGEELTFDCSSPPPLPHTYAPSASALAPCGVACKRLASRTLHADGEGYWHGCSAMLAAGTDSRNFSLKTEKYAKPQGPPPVTPRTLDELEVRPRCAHSALIHQPHTAPTAPPFISSPPFHKPRLVGRPSIHRPPPLNASETPLPDEWRGPCRLSAHSRVLWRESPLEWRAGGATRIQRCCSHRLHDGDEALR